MDTNDGNASFAKIGFIVFSGVVAIIASLIYFGGLRGRGDQLLVETYYDMGVSGLSVGSPVNFRGVKIGVVKEISFVGSKYGGLSSENNVKVYILMALDRRQLGIDAEEWAHADGRVRGLVARGLTASVTASGITGMSRIEFNVHPDFTPPPPPVWRPEHLYVPPEASFLDSFSDTATRVMNQINRMDLNAAWSNLYGTVESMSAMSMSLRHTLDSRQPELERIMSNLESASQSLSVFAERVRENPSLLIRNGTVEPLPETNR